MGDRLKLGVVGAGVVLDRCHMPAINAVPEVVRTILIDADADRARREAERYGFPQWSTDLAELVRHADLAIVLVPNGLHASVSCELLGQGIHVLCEKPMARNTEECLAMIEAARRGNAQLCIGHNRRFQQHIKLARQLLQKGLIGEIVGVQAEEGSTSDWPRSPVYFDPVISGGGALLDVGIHSIDLIRWFAGEFDQLEYQGNGTAAAVESDARLNFSLANGAKGSVVTSRTRNLAQKLTLVGTEGFLEIGLWYPTLGIRSAKGKAFQNFYRLDAAVPRRPPLDGSFVDQLRNLVAAIKHEQDVLVNGHEGMAAVEVVRRAYTGQPAEPLLRNTRP
ncbi:MAG: Gfo/Idh/MocA family oxidoreductase [Candidatus Acidiferrales bacterium]